MPIEIRPARAADWPQLRLALMQYSPTWLAPATWDWRYRHPDQPLRSWLALDGETIRAHVGVLQLEAPRGRKLVLLRDVFVRNRQRGGLAGLRLMRELHQAITRAELGRAALMLQAGDSRWLACQQHLGLAGTTCRSDWLTFDTAAMVATGRRVLVYAQPAFDAALAGLWQQAGVRKTAAYLSWRYDARYGQRCQIYLARTADQAGPVGCLVLAAVNPQQELVLEAQLPADLAQARDMLAQIASQRAQAGVRQLIVHAPQHGQATRWQALGWPHQSLPGSVHCRYVQKPGVEVAAMLAGLNLGDVS